MLPGFNHHGGINMGLHSGSQTLSEADLAGVLSEREQASPVRRVLDSKTREVVGWLYQWNTGHLAVMWKSERHKDVIYE